MLLIVKTVGIHKMCMFAAKLLCPFIHHFYKLVLVPGDKFPNSVTYFICGFQQDAVEGFFNCNLLSHTHANVVTSEFNIVNGIF